MAAQAQAVVIRLASLPIDEECRAEILQLLNTPKQRDGILRAIASCIAKDTPLSRKLLNVIEHESQTLDLPPRLVMRAKQIALKELNRKYLSPLLKSITDSEHGVLSRFREALWAGMKDPHQAVSAMRRQVGQIRRALPLPPQQPKFH